jgi:uncharacterized protein
VLLYVDDINDKGLSLEFEEKPQTFPALEKIANSGVGEFHPPIKVWLKAIRIKNMIQVEGNFAVQVRLTCSRCLKEFEMPLQSPFSLTFTQETPEAASERDEEEIELSAEEIGYIMFKGREIDLTPALQEQVVMSLPMQPLCAKPCKGLCPICGTDLNQSDCGCQRKSVSTKFAALKDLKLNKK